MDCRGISLWFAEFTRKTDDELPKKRLAMLSNLKFWRNAPGSQTKQKRSKRIAARLCQIEQLESRQLMAAAIWNNVLQPLDVSPNNVVSPLDALLIVNEINNPFYADRNTRRLPDQYTGADTPPMIDVTCDQFVTPLDALLVINTLNTGISPTGWQFDSQGGQAGNAGRFESAACAPRLVEGSSLVTQLQSQIKLPSATSAVRVNFDMPTFDITSQGTMRDAFEILIVDANNQPLALPYRYGRESSYNWSEELAPLAAPGMQSSTSSATINLAGIATGTPVKVIARLINNDNDDTTSVVVRSVEVIASTDAAPVGAPANTLERIPLPAINFAALTDVSSTFTTTYGRTTLTSDPSVVSSEFQLTNTAALPVRGDLIAVVKMSADSTAALMNPDGFTPDGLPYLNLSTLAPDGVTPGETIAARAIQFRISSQERFDYTIQLLSGFNQPPVLTAIDNSEILVGKSSSWQLQGSDPDGDELTYKLISPPSGMTIDPTSGRLQWTPVAADVGRWSIMASVEDRFGASASARFELNVRQEIPNRPPVFTSTPNTDAQITSPYEVLTYPLGALPMAADVVPSARGSSNSLASIVTANAGDQQLGWLGGQFDTLSPTQAVDIGEPRPSLYPTPFITGLNVPLDLVPFTQQNLEREIQGVLSADVNHDSIPDVIVAASMYGSGSLANANELGYVIVRFGIGDGTFREGWRTALPVVTGRSGRVVSMHWLDVTNDALPDLIVTTQVSNQTLVFPGQADGMLSSVPIQSTNISNYVVSTQLADVNGDDQVDLITFEAVSFTGARQGIGIQLGDGTGNFSGNTLIPAENNNDGLGYVADVDGVNGPDIVRLNYSSTRVEVWLNDGNGQFGAPQYSDVRGYLTATNNNGSLLNPTSAYLDDFDGDGKIDALVSTYQTILLLAGQGNGRFGDRTPTGNLVLVANDGDTPQWPNRSQADGRAPDFDGNGLLDFVFGDGDQGGNFLIGLQQADHSFTLSQFSGFHTNEIGVGTRGVRTNPFLTIADFNLDGINDIVTGSKRDATNPGSVGIFLGNAPGTLRSPNFVNSFEATNGSVERGRGNQATAGDFNNDGHEDIVVAAGLGFGQAFFFAAGRGDGSFVQDEPVLGGITSASSLTTLDIDRDGNLDIAWIDGGRSGAAFGLGNGAFERLPALTLDGGPSGVSNEAMQVGDFNQDGYPDLVMRLQTGNIDNNFITRIVVLLYNPSSRRYDRLSDTQNLLTNTPRRGGFYIDESIGMGDLNNDGIDEFFTYSVPINDTIPGRFSVWERRNTTGSDASDFFTKTTIENPSFIPASTSMYASVVDDFDHDGKNDLAYSNHETRLVVMFGEGDFTFRDMTSYVTNGHNIRSGDFNGDGLVDIATAWSPGFLSNSLRPYSGIMLGRADGSFSEQQATVAAGNYTWSPVVGDFNGDGIDDLTGLGGLKHLETYVSRSAGLTDLETGDIDGDGLVDVLAISQDYARVKLLWGQGDQSLSREADLITGLLPVDLELVDADGDDLLDILTANQVDQSLSLFTHTSPKTLVRADIPLPIRPSQLVVGDINGDAVQDVIVISEQSQSLVVMTGKAESYELALTLPLGFAPAGVALGDVTGDGRLDVVLTDDLGDRIVIMAGQGNGTFGVPTFIPAIADPTHVALADMNLDGRMDIVVTQTEHDQLSMLFNRGAGRFTTPQTIKLGDAPSSLRTRDANGDGRPDLLVTNSGDNTLSLILNRFDPDQVWSYQPTATDPDGDAVQFDLQSAPGGMLIDSATGKVYWAPMPEQLGRSGVVLTVNDGRGGFSEQGFSINVTAPASVDAPIFTSQPVTAFSADEVYNYQPNVQSEIAGALRYSLVEAPVGMTIDPGTGKVEWDNRSSGLKLYANSNGFSTTVNNISFGRIEVPDSANLRSASVTAEGWFNFVDPRGALYEQLISKGATANRNDVSWGLEYFFGNLRAKVGRADGTVLAMVTSPVPATFGKWTHLAMTFDDATKQLSLIVDGQLVGSATSPESIGYSDKPLFLGPNYITMTRTRVWNTARSVAEIANNRLTEVPHDAPGLVMALAFDESTATTTVLDRSPLGNNGAIINAPDPINFPQRLPTLASEGSHNVRIRVDDGRGGVAEQSFTIASRLPYTTDVMGVVFEDQNANGIWDRRAGENLVLNGDFASGNRSFTTDFVYREATATSLGNLQTTTSNAASGIPLSGNYQGHTNGSSSDLMLVVNGDQQDRVAWRQTVATEPGLTYAFSFWAMRPNNIDPGRLAVRINGQPIGSTLALASAGDGVYTQFLSNFPAEHAQSIIEIVLLGSPNPANPGLNTAENAVAIDDILLIPSTARRVLVSGKANPFLAGMPDGSTALGSAAPASSPTSVAVTPGEVLRFTATGQTVSQGFIVGRTPDGWPDIVSTNALNGLSGYQMPTGALIGVFLNDTAPNGQTPPASLDFRDGGNVPGGLNYESLAPQLRQTFFIGDGKNAQGVEQTITVPAGATRLMLANGGSSSWQSNRGSFEVQIFNSTSEPGQSGRTLFVDGNANNRFDDGEATVTTDASGLFKLAVPGEGAQIGLLTKSGQVQSTPLAPYQVIKSDNKTLISLWSSRALDAEAAPQFIVQPNFSTIELTAPSTYNYQAFAQSANGLPVNYSIASGPQGLSIDYVSGLLSWDPRATDAGEHDVIIKAVDSVGRFSLQRFTLSVTANTAPIIVSVPHVHATQQVPYEYHVLTQDAEQIELRYELLNAPSDMTIDRQSGVIRWTPTTAGTVTGTVRVLDQVGGIVEQTLNIDVSATSTNHAPAFNQPLLMQAIVNRPFGAWLKASDADHDSLNFELISGPTGLTISPAGQLSWVPNELGTTEIQVRVRDSRGSFDTITMSIETLTRSSVSSLSIQSTPTTAALIGEVFAYDVVAPGAMLFELETHPDGMSIDPQRGTVRWLPTKDHLGVHTIQISVSDVLGNAVQQSFNLTVRSDAIVPTISSAPPTEAAVGQTFVYPVRLSNPSRSPLTFSLTVAPPGMQIDSASGVVTWTPTPGQTGSAPVVLRAADALGNYSSQAFTIMVAAGAINQPPVVSSTAGLDAIVSQAYRYTLQASDPEGSALTYAVRLGPTGLTIDSVSGVVTWIPTADDIGTAAVVLTATDAQGGVAVQSLAIDVRPANRAPAIRSNPTTKVSQGGLYQYDVIASDPDREPLFYQLVTGPVGMTIDALGRVRWQTALNTPLGANQVEVKVVDGLGAETTQSFTFAVVADTQAPRLTIIVAGEPVLYPWTTTPAIVRVIASDDVGLTNVQLLVDGEPVELSPEGTVRVYFSAPGKGRLEALATDAAGNVGRATGRVSMRSGDEDGGGNPAPDVQITSVSNNATVSGLVDIIGTAAAPDFESYTLSYRRADDTTYKTILNGATQVVAGSLGKWDTTLLENDNYVLKLEVVDTFGSFAATEVEVSVTGLLKLGNFRLSFEDLTIPVAGIPLTVIRTYDSLRADKAGDFGYGWRLEFRNADLRTSLPKSGLEDLGIYTPFKTGARVYITLPGGVREGFTFTPEIRVLPGFGQDSFLVTAAPRFTPDPGVRSTLSAGGGRLIVNEFGELFAAGGIPWNPASPDFGGYRLTTKDGTQYAIDGATGKMQSATDRNGNSVTFSDSTIQSSTGETLSLLRDIHGRIVELIDPAGKSIHYSYSAGGDLQSVTDRLGNVSQLRYRGTTHYLDQVIDPLGRVGARVEYDADGRLVKAINGSGGQATIDYDLESQVVSVADALGRVTTTEYDALGNVVTVVDASGNTTRFTNDDNGQVLTQTDALGRTTRFTYDVRGNQVQSTNALGNTVRATYDRFGNVTSQVDPLGNSTLSTYDARGNLLSIADAAGNITSMTTVSGGQLGQVTNAAGLRLGLEYGSSGNVVRSTDASGRTTQLVYNATGQIIESHSTTTLGSQVTLLSETQTYDANGRLTSETDAAGGKTQYEYDPAGQLTAQVDALGRRTTYQYDAAGRRTVTQFADGTLERNEFDQAGQLISVIDVMNRRTQYEYDSLGRLITTIYPDETPGQSSDNPRTRTEYDAVGNVIATIDEVGLRTETSYDAAGRPIRIQYPGGGIKLMSYDAAGNLISETDPLGRTSSYRYNSLGQLVVTVDSEGRSIQLAYNSDGQRTRLVDSSGAVTEHVYGADGQLQAVIDPLGNRTQYANDNRGLLVAVTNANGETTSYSRDVLGREVERKLPGGQKFVTQYDAVGNVTKTIDPDGHEVRFEYDQRNRLTKKTVGTSVVTFTYSAAGRKLTTVDGRGTTTYRYDARDRLIEQVEPDGKTLRYSYDAASRRLSLDVDGKTARYEYDAAGRLSTVRDAEDQLTRYTYDVVGNLTRTEYPNGVTETRQYNAAQRLIRITAANASTVLTDFRYTLDANDRVVGILDADGRLSEYRYDQAGRLITETITQGPNVQRVEYHFDGVGNRLSKSDTVSGTTTYTYDANDRLLSSTINGVTTTYSYNATGDLLRAEGGDEQLSNTWDAEHRLISTTRVKAGVSKTERYEYDDQGNRVVVIDADGQSHRYLLDTANALAEIVAEYASSGVLLASYTRGLELISIDQVASGHEYYLADRLGSVRAIVGASGNVMETFIYDAYGVVTGGVDASGQARFTGEPLSVVSNYTYLRARYYDAQLGRFVSADPFAGELGAPISLHKYAYAFLDPANLTDPSGQWPDFSLASLSVALSTISIVSSAVSIGFSLTGHTELAHYFDILSYVGLFGSIGVRFGTLSLLKAGPAAFKAVVTAGQNVAVNFTFASLNAAAKVASKAVYLALRDSALKAAQHGATQEAVTLSGKTLARNFVRVIDEHIAKSGFRFLGKPARDIFASVAQKELKIIHSWLNVSKLVSGSNANLLIKTIEKELELLLL